MKLQACTRGVGYGPDQTYSYFHYKLHHREVDYLHVSRAMNHVCDILSLTSVKKHTDG